MGFDDRFAAWIQAGGGLVDPVKRTRLIAAAAMLVLLPLGFVTKAVPIDFVYGHLGDVLIVVFLCLLGRFVFPGAAAWKIALVVLAYAFCVEFSQLYRAPWLDAARNTLPGKVLLGTTFQWMDFVMYLTGAFTSVWIDARWRLRCPFPRPSGTARARER